MAVEKSEMAARTFAHNLIFDAEDPRGWDDYLSKPLNYQSQHGLVVNELAVVLEDENLMSDLKDRELDLVVGGPPCQGFSLAGRRNPNDTRNELPWQYLDFIQQTAPAAVVIENVVGMDRKFPNSDSSPFNDLCTALEATPPGYLVQKVNVNAMHYGAPQHRPRLMLIAMRNDIASDLGLTVSSDTWNSAFLPLTEIPDLVPRPTVSFEERRTVRDAIWDLQDAEVHNSDGPQTYLEEMTDATRWGLKPVSSTEKANHVLRKHRVSTIERFAIYQSFASHGVDNRVIHRYSSADPSGARQVVQAAVHPSLYPIKTPSGNVVAATEDDLLSLLNRLRTKKHSQRVLRWDEPARTVVTLPDDYVHPSEARVLTVRELARLQGFPDAFTFLGKETTGALRRRLEVPQYSQVGNAVSPWLAYAVGTRISEVLSMSRRMPKSLCDQAAAKR